MIVHDLYIFDRQGACLYYAEWARPHKSLKEADDRKMMFGLFFSLKAFAVRQGFPYFPPSALQQMGPRDKNQASPARAQAKMDPTSDGRLPMGAAQPTWAGCSFHAFRTNSYKLHFLEAPSGLKARLTLIEAR